jgi:hypothetical protein
MTIEEETKDQTLMSDSFLYFAFPTVGRVKPVSCVLGRIQGKMNKIALKYLSVLAPGSPTLM